MFAAASSAVWAKDTLAGLADTGTTLADGTALLVGRIAFAAAGGPAFTLQVDGGDPPDFAALAGEYAHVCLRARRRVCRRTAARPSSCAS